MSREASKRQQPPLYASESERNGKARASRVLHDGEKDRVVEELSEPGFLLPPLQGDGVVSQPGIPPPPQGDDFASQPGELEAQLPSPPPPPPKDPNLVEFDGPNDPGNPQNFTTRRKTAATVSMGLMTFVVTFSSSVFAVAVDPISSEYNVSTVVATLGVSLFLLGFVLGPPCFGPASEIWGRRVPLFAGYLCFAIFQVPVAVAQNLATIMICRFLGGFAASAPLAVVGGALGDLWGPVERAYAVCAFAAGAFSGPVAGPIIGGFVTESYLGWRWTQWIVSEDVREASVEC